MQEGKGTKVRNFRNKKKATKAAFGLGKEVSKRFFDHINKNAINAESRLAWSKYIFLCQ